MTPKSYKILKRQKQKFSKNYTFWGFLINSKIFLVFNKFHMIKMNEIQNIVKNKILLWVYFKDYILRFFFFYLKYKSLSGLKIYLSQKYYSKLHQN